jgi:hypothetical protein
MFTVKLWRKRLYSIHTKTKMNLSPAIFCQSFFPLFFGASVFGEGGFPQQGLPDFCLFNIPKHWKMYQMATKLPNGHQITKWPYYIPKDKKHINFFSIQGPPKSTQICIFGLKA